MCTRLTTPGGREGGRASGRQKRADKWPFRLRLSGEKGLKGPGRKEGPEERSFWIIARLKVAWEERSFKMGNCANSGSDSSNPNDNIKVTKVRNHFQNRRHVKTCLRPFYDVDHIEIARHNGTKDGDGLTDGHGHAWKKSARHCVSS